MTPSPSVRTVITTETFRSELAKEFREWRKSWNILPEHACLVLARHTQDAIDSDEFESVTKQLEAVGRFCCRFHLSSPRNVLFSLISTSAFLKNDNRVRAENILSPQFCFIKRHFISPACEHALL
jgi:hypothetical protein